MSDRMTEDEINEAMLLPAFHPRRLDAIGQVLEEANQSGRSQQIIDILEGIQKEREMDDLTELAREASSKWSEHIEMLACAYVKACDIDPRDAVLCQQFTKDGMRIWFQRKETLDT